MKKGRIFTAFFFISTGLLLGLFLLRFEDLPAVVITALRADGIGGNFRAAIGARDQVGRRQGVVRAAAIPPSGGMFSLWMWWHGSYSSENIGKTAGKAKASPEVWGLYV
jgi:hypothetical protein